MNPTNLQANRACGLWAQTLQRINKADKTMNDEKQPTVASPIEPVVMRQKRHKISNEHCVDFGEWQEWEECDIDDYNNVRSLIEAGYNYEVRELVVAS